jgi:hypothetical protein
VETWESTDSLGNVVNVFGRQVTIDGNLLATAIGDTWVISHLENHGRHLNHLSAISLKMLQTR